MRFDIYRKRLLEMSRTGLIVPIHLTAGKSPEPQELPFFEMQDQSICNEASSRHAHTLLAEDYLPGFERLSLHHWKDESSFSWRLWTIAEKSKVNNFATILNPLSICL